MARNTATLPSSTKEHNKALDKEIVDREEKPIDAPWWERRHWATLDAVINNHRELWPQSLGEWEVNGKPVTAHYSYIDWNEEDGWTFINIKVRDESKASDIATDLAMVGGCHVRVLDELEYRSEQMGEPEGRA